MTKQNAFNIGGVVAVVGGCIALYLGGTSVGAATEIVGSVFVLIGLIAALFKAKEVK